MPHRELAEIDPDEFVPLMSAYELSPADADLNRRPIVVRERLDIRQLYLDPEGNPLRTTDERGQTVYADGSGEGPKISLIIYEFGPPDRVEHTYYALFETLSDGSSRHAADPEIIARFNHPGSPTRWAPLTPERRAFAAAAAARVPAEDHERTTIGYEEIRERQTAEGLLRLQLREYFDEAEVIHDLYQVIGDRLARIPFERWEEIDPFVHKKRPEEMAAQARAVAALSGEPPF